MARQFILFGNGSFGNIVMYQLGDKHVIRSRPTKVRKTANMKTCSSNFGIAARAGKFCRQGLAAVIPDVKDIHMQCRFSGAINSWLGKQSVHTIPSQKYIKGLSGFNFSDCTSFYERFKKRIIFNNAVPGMLQVDVPAFDGATDITAPAHTVAIELNIAVAAYELGADSLANFHHYSRRFNYATHQPADSFGFNIPVGNKMLLITAASLTYFFTDGRRETRDAFMPASVIDATYNA